MMTKPHRIFRFPHRAISFPHFIFSGRPSNKRFRTDNSCKLFNNSGLENGAHWF